MSEKRDAYALARQELERQLLGAKGGTKISQNIMQRAEQELRMYNADNQNENKALPKGKSAAVLDNLDLNVVQKKIQAKKKTAKVRPSSAWNAASTKHHIPKSDAK